MVLFYRGSSFPVRLDQDSLSCVLLQLLLRLMVVRAVEFVSYIKKPKIKGKFLYCAVPSPRDCSKRFTLYSHGRPVQSNNFSGKHPAIILCYN